MLMQTNAVVFRHAHRLANGQIITHAHPYNIFGESCPLSSNPHTTHELLLLDAVSNPAFVLTFVLLFAFLFPFKFVNRPVTPRPAPAVPTLHPDRSNPRGLPAPASR